VRSSDIGHRAYRAASAGAVHVHRHVRRRCPTAVSDLLVSAVKYQVPALQSKCEQFIAAHTTTVNVIDVLHLAELHQSSFLKSRALSVVVGNIKGLLQQDGFMDGIKDGLWHDIMRAMVAEK
jgi:uncharacterized protein (DUF849 family)